MTPAGPGLAVLGVNVVAGVVVLAAAASAGAERLVADQSFALQAAALALVAALAADVAAVLQGRRRLALRRHELRAGPYQLELAGRSATVATAAALGADDLVALPGAGRYHRLGCAFVAGRATMPATRAEHEGARRRPCGVCRL